MTRTRPNERVGITLDHWNYMRVADAAFRQWADAILAAVAGGVELEPCNEALNTWTLTKLAARHWNWLPTPRTTVREYRTIIHTPPARPEWLTTITPEDPETGAAYEWVPDAPSWSGARADPGREMMRGITAIKMPEPDDDAPATVAVQPPQQPPQPHKPEKGTDMAGEVK